MSLRPPRPCILLGFGLLACVGATGGCFGPQSSPLEDTDGDDETTGGTTAVVSTSGAATSSATTTGAGTRSSTDDTAGSSAGGTDASGSTSEGSEGSTGEAEPTCGDGIVNGEEVCDDGVNAGQTAGDCNPDCSVIVQRKIIRLSQGEVTSDFGGVPNPVAFADEQCPIGYLALFADGTNRVASLSPNMGNGQVDWVIQPWTEYVNDADERIWTTTDLRLLGVGDDHEWDGFENAVTVDVHYGKTGLLGDYTTSTMNCSNWTGSGLKAFGQTQRTDALAIGHAVNEAGGNCLTPDPFICVEQ